MLWIFLTLYLVSGCLTQIANLPRNCPVVKAKENFDIKRYLGKWYGAGKYASSFDIELCSVTEDFVPNADGSIQMHTEKTYKNGVTSNIDGIGRQIDGLNVGKFMVTIPSLPFGIKVPYVVVDTDYDNYAVTLSCDEFGVGIPWTMTRSKNRLNSVIDPASLIVLEGLPDYVLTELGDCLDSD